MTNSARTYTTAFRPDASQDEALQEYARLFSQAVRTSYAASERAVRAGTEWTKTQRKARLQGQFALTSRQVNAVLVEADGKRRGIQELYQTHLQEQQSRLRQKRRKLAEAQTKRTKHKVGF